MPGLFHIAAMPTAAHTRAAIAVTGKLKLGLSGGVSRNRDDLVDDADFKSNSNVTGGAYHARTKSVTLSVELSQIRPRYLTGETARQNGISAGGILFF